MPTSLDLFQGQWRQPLPLELSLLGNMNGRYQALGQSMILGQKVWDQSAGILITFGPLSWSLCQSFLPLNVGNSKSSWDLFKQVCKLYVGYEVDLRLKLILDPKEVKPLTLNRHFALGLNSWLDPRPSVARDFTVNLKVD